MINVGDAGVQEVEAICQSADLVVHLNPYAIFAQY